MTSDDLLAETIWLAETIIGDCDGQSSTIQKVRVLQKVTPVLVTMGEIDLGRAIDYWHALAKRLRLPYSTIDLEISICKQRRERGQRV